MDINETVTSAPLEVDIHAVPSGERNDGMDMNVHSLYPIICYKLGHERTFNASDDICYKLADLPLQTVFIHTHTDTHTHTHTHTHKLTHTHKHARTHARTHVRTHNTTQHNTTQHNTTQRSTETDRPREADRQTEAEESVCDKSTVWIFHGHS